MKDDEKCKEEEECVCVLHGLEDRTGYSRWDGNLFRCQLITLTDKHHEYTDQSCQHQPLSAAGPTCRNFFFFARTASDSAERYNAAGESQRENKGGNRVNSNMLGEEPVCCLRHEYMKNNKGWWRLSFVMFDFLTLYQARNPYILPKMCLNERTRIT